MTQDQALWTKEQTFWDRSPSHPMADRKLTFQNGIAILTYLVTGRSRAMRCRSTYARACGSWMLLEHRQSPVAP